MANEDLAPHERALSAAVLDRAPERLELSLVLSGGRRARCEVQIAVTDRVTLRLSPDGDPLRVALDWRRRADEHMVGLGARHWTQFDQGRDVSFREMG